MEFRNLGRIDPSTPAEEFFTEYVSKRKPVIIRALLDDSSFHAQKWTDLDYLASKAGDTEVMVEPMHPTVHQFGTDVKRVSIPFRDFLTSLRKETGSYDYLTTQYGEEEDDKDAETVFPPPTNALRDDFPSVPRLMGNLFLQQVNLWIGRSEEGSTSGLHHDFHDNLYCLLQGRKRFVLFPPEELKNLYPYGKLDTLHRNGLISYKDVPVREDGLSRRAACKARIKALERKIDALRETESGKAKGKSKGKRSKEMKTLMEAHDEALDELAMIALNERHGFAWEEEVDDFDELMGDLEEDAGLGDIGAGPSGDGIGDIEDDEDEGDDEGLGKLGEDEEEEDNENEEEKVGNEPSSFSRIPTALLHKHLGLPTTAISPPDISLDDFPALLKAGTPYVVELHAGEMLYLPTSWWHEVTSSSGAEDVHMAFNYWFYPPDALETFDAPYRDTLVWEYLREKGDARIEKDALEGKAYQKLNHFLASMLLFDVSYTGLLSPIRLTDNLSQSSFAQPRGEMERVRWLFNLLRNSGCSHCQLWLQNRNITDNRVSFARRHPGPSPQHIIHTLDPARLTSSDFVDLSNRAPDIWDRRDLSSWFTNSTGRSPVLVIDSISAGKPAFRCRYSTVLDSLDTEAHFPPHARLPILLRPTAPLSTRRPVRFRLTQYNSPRSFASGTDLLQPNGIIPWQLSLLATASTTQYKGILRIILRDNLVSPSTTEIPSWCILTRCPPICTWWGRIQSMQSFSYTHSRSGAEVGRSFPISRSPLEEHAGTRTVVLRIMKIIDPVQLVDSSLDGFISEPREGKLAKRGGRPWAFDRNNRSHCSRAMSLSDCDTVTYGVQSAII
ncbi:JmjC domain-containing protein 4 [Grifola frondosa]|uniref:JmjC domain-containing protein 4 n=1 Tax=Grifola frondosa TaxID=5627 RepID=A0A1C7MDQ5_GRIFR|nr:JmjC domain-containing protein 4 [Grifola frondosa]